MKQEQLSAVSRLIQDAQRDQDSDRNADLFDRYMGELYGDEVKGRSKYVSSDVSDAIESIMPDIMDVFVGAEETFKYKPVGPEDEAAAEQETEVVENLFWQQNEGFNVLSTWFKEAMIQKVSYVRRGWVEKTRVTIDEYEDLTPEELMIEMIALEGQEYEILSQEQRETPMGVVTDMKVRCVKASKEYEIEPIPQEEFFVSPRWNKLKLEGVPCCGHRRSMTRSDLISMGFDEKSLDQAQAEAADEEQTQARFDTDGTYEEQADSGDKSTRKLEVFEAYCYVDINDDGISELIKVWAANDGNTILQWESGEDAWEEVDGLPFHALTPIIVPHRHIGRAIAELVEPIQRAKSVLMRHTLDNLYSTNYPRPHYDENLASEHTYDDLLNPTHGAPVRTGGAMIDWKTPQPVIGATLPVMEKLTADAEQRTGATRYNQGLDANSLNKTATGVQRIMDAGTKRLQLIARTFAETGLKELFLGIHADMRKGPVKELAMKLRGEWVNVNPREWRERTDLTVMVGMGTGDRDKKRMFYEMTGDVQRELMVSGSALVDDEKLYNTYRGMAKTFGFSNVEAFMNDPAKIEPPAPQPDPQAEFFAEQAAIARADFALREREVNARIRREDIKLQFEMGIKTEAEDRQQAKTASDIYTNEGKLELDRNKAVMSDDLERDKMRGAGAPAVPYGQV